MKQLTLATAPWRTFRAPALIRLRLLALVLAGLAGCGGGLDSVPTGEEALEQALRQLRPHSAASLRVRACLKWRLGRHKSARREALIGLLVDPKSAAGCRQAAAMELALGQPGAALSLLERAHAEENKEPTTRAALAALLLTRAQQRMDPRMGLLQLGQAELDLRRAVKIFPKAGPRACQIKDGLARLQARSGHPGGLAHLRGLGGDPFRTNVGCPGPPRGMGADLPALAPGGKCGLSRPTSYLPRLRRRYLLVGCAGAQLGLRLERWGCLDQALEVWQALMTESPADARWPLQAARVFLARGEAPRAEPLLTDHVFLSLQRDQAMLDTAKIQLKAGNKAQAARRATRALDLALTREQAKAAINLIFEAGYEAEASQAYLRVEAKSWPTGKTTPR